MVNIDETILATVLQQATEQAAAVLAEMLEQEVQIRLFEVKQPGLRDLNHIVIEYSTEVTAVRLKFSGIFSGHAYLLLPKGQSQQLVEIIGDQFELENNADHLEIVLGEIGNVILNAVVGVLANQLGMRVTFEIPQVIGEEKGFEKDIRKIQDIIACSQQSYLLTSQLVIRSFSIQMVILVIFFGEKS